LQECNFQEMKRFLFLFTIMLFCISIFSTLTVKAQVNKAEAKTDSLKSGTDPHGLNYADQSTWVLGFFTRDRLMNPPYSEWFIKGYDDYQFNSDAINKLLNIGTGNITIKIVMGTWCPDSRREVPRFMRIIDAWHFPETNITFIGVDDLKQSPIGDYDKLDILRVPTFIIYRNNIEAGRIIENPKTSLEQDIVNILIRNE
jgi:thiol-disulfide isomerase/thioredoxin